MDRPTLTQEYLILNEWKRKSIKELARTAKEFISSGMDKEVALQIVKNSTILSRKLFAQVVELVNYEADETKTSIK